MTRAEAEKILCDTLNHGETQAVRWVDALESLGILKLDCKQPEPIKETSQAEWDLNWINQRSGTHLGPREPSSRDRAIKALTRRLGYSINNPTASTIVDILLDSGFELRDRYS